MMMSTPKQVLKAESEMKLIESKRKQLLADNKATARLLLIGILSNTESEYSTKVRHDWNGKE